MLFKFLGYTEWPEQTFDSADSPYRIWVLGDSNVSKELKQITAGRTLGDRPIKVYRARTVEHINNPHVVFVGRHAAKYLPAVAKRAEKQSFLVVSEAEAGLDAGSTINLRFVEGRVGFDVSLERAQKNKLRLSARLLSVASSVEQSNP